MRFNLNQKIKIVTTSFEPRTCSIWF